MTWPDAPWVKDVVTALIDTWNMVPFGWRLTLGAMVILGLLLKGLLPGIAAVVKAFKGGSDGR